MAGGKLEERLLRGAVDEWDADRVRRAALDVRFKENGGDVHADEVVVRAAVEGFDLCDERFCLLSMGGCLRADLIALDVEGHDVDLHRGLTGTG